MGLNMVWGAARHAGLAGRPYLFFDLLRGLGRHMDPGGGRRAGPFKKRIWPAGQAGMAGRPPIPYLIYYI